MFQQSVDELTAALSVLDSQIEIDEERLREMRKEAIKLETLKERRHHIAAALSNINIAKELLQPMALLGESTKDVPLWGDAEE